MAKLNTKTNIVAISLMTALAVGVINTASAYIAYSSFIPKKQAAGNEPFVSSNTEPVITLQPEQPTEGAPPTGSSPQTSPNKTSRQVVRKPSATIIVGQAPQPATLTTSPDGKITYRWCSGINPNLEDTVCEAVISVAANPTASNPHLSEKAKKSLSMLPKDSTLTMDESSWASSSPSAGTMLVTLHTKAYGDVKVKLFLEKINSIWVVADGQLT